MFENVTLEDLFDQEKVGALIDRAAADAIATCSTREEAFLMGVIVTSTLFKHALNEMFTASHEDTL